MLRLLACLVAMAFAVLAVTAEAAAQTADPAGRWALRSQGRPMMIVTLRREAGGGWRGEVERPRLLTTDASAASLTEVDGPQIVRTIVSARATPEGLALSIAQEQGNGPPDIMVLSVRADGTARLRPPWMSGEGFVLDRAAAGEALFAAWDAKAEYPVDQHWQTNPEMRRLFEQDQAARSVDTIDWAKVSPEDVARRKATRALLDAGKLASADDFYHAAFVFQHGDKPEDFLLAHTLALVSAARGKPGAAWIAAATLDRYLMAIGQKQVYGTQFRFPEKSEATQDPYDRTLVSDSLRAALGVPALAEQEQARAAYPRKQ